MKKVVIMSGGFHPWHGGHTALYQQALRAFPSADVFVAATDDTSGRPFPFKIKKFLAQQAGVPGNRFIRVKSPFRAEEITQMYDPNDTVLIFVRSEKDAMKHPQPGGVKKDGSPAYLQPYKRNKLGPFSKHGYMAYLPTVQFGPGMTSATEIRAKWPEMSLEEKISLVKTLYPNTATKDAAAGKIVNILDKVMGSTIDETLQGAPTGTGALTMQPQGTDQPNGPDQEPVANRPGFAEATVINDPQGLMIQPTGGMGTWDEKSMVSNLASKFASLASKLKARDYHFVYGALYQDQWIQNMTRALAELQAFQTKQGARPIARGREIDTSDYLDEAPPQF